MPGQDCLHSAQQLHGYLPVAKHPPIRQLPVSSDQKSEGSEGRYGLLGAWHPGLPGARVGVVKAWQGPAAFLKPSPKIQVGKQPAHFVKYSQLQIPKESVFELIHWGRVTNK